MRSRCLLTSFVVACAFDVDDSSVLLQSREGAKVLKVGKIPGINDLKRYQRFAKAFVGLNPQKGEYSTNVQNDLCTCDCKAGSDGIRCTGWGGNGFRYNSLLWQDPDSKNEQDSRNNSKKVPWMGQMQAWQSGKENPGWKEENDPLWNQRDPWGNLGDQENQVGTEEFNFIGQDVRMYPGGPVIYNVACTSGGCNDHFSGPFRQSNSKVSCAAANEQGTATTSCNKRCVTEGQSTLYTEWLEYCNAPKEDSSLGFTGWDATRYRGPDVRG